MMSKRPGYCESKKDEEDSLYCAEDQLINWSIMHAERGR